jgi:hypothetical protein
MCFIHQEEINTLNRDFSEMKGPESPEYLTGESTRVSLFEKI